MPAWRKALARAKPMPLAPPVTKAVLPLKSRISISRAVHSIPDSRKSAWGQHHPSAIKRIRPLHTQLRKDVPGTGWVTRSPGRPWLPSRDDRTRQPCLPDPDISDEAVEAACRAHQAALAG